MTMRTTKIRTKRSKPVKVGMELVLVLILVKAARSWREPWGQAR
jgi:hypothetical protein